MMQAMAEARMKALAAMRISMTPLPSVEGTRASPRVLAEVERFLWCRTRRLFTESYARRKKPRWRSVMGFSSFSRTMSMSSQTLRFSLRDWFRKR